MRKESLIAFCNGQKGAINLLGLGVAVLLQYFSLKTYQCNSLCEILVSW